eukprot:TRINITY_DN2407_c0_g1_i1.p2 TRINITY_DN2407_c0_g1~~TRINITY_DN2407_c0_g1_i1.p2  ORF type:complete len:117 (+),score=33.68 TRINITY_DN2407_c0_g1_i1:1348-1698(+)
MAYEKDPEIQKIITILEKKCNGGKTNIDLCEGVLSSGNLQPHPVLAVYYHRLAGLCVACGKPPHKWMTAAVAATESKLRLSVDSISLWYFGVGDEKEAEKRTEQLYGPEGRNTCKS